MFDQDFLESLSCANPIWLALLYGIGSAWLLWQGLGVGIGATGLAGAYLGGLLAWSLLEYVAHRGSFHHAPTTRWQVAYVYLVHGVHHAYPDDSRRWVMPLVVTVPVALLFFFLFRVTLGAWAWPAFAGFLHGYLVYDLLHYFIHRGRLPTRLGRYLRQYHLAHHYASPDRHYGVSSPLWDIVFRTR
jgi:sterol desaturase/sphingolipid hydroxylase (fatty acid hydroxylase superfamily)